MREKNPGPQDWLKRLIMSDDMKADEEKSLSNLILNACKKIGVDDSDSGYQKICEAFTKGNGYFHVEMINLATQEAMVQHIRKHGF